MEFRRLLGALILVACSLYAAVTGSVSGILRDQAGGVIPGAKLTATNTAQGLKIVVSTDAKGAYSFPSLPVGTYDIDFEAPGFRTERRTGQVIDANAVVQMDISMTIAERIEEVTVAAEADQIHVEAASTQLGEVVTGSEMTSVALKTT